MHVACESQSKSCIMPEMWIARESQKHWHRGEATAGEVNLLPHHPCDNSTCVGCSMVGRHVHEKETERSRRGCAVPCATESRGEMRMVGTDDVQRGGAQRPATAMLGAQSLLFSLPVGKGKSFKLQKLDNYLVKNVSPNVAQVAWHLVSMAKSTWWTYYTVEIATKSL